MSMDKIASIPLETTAYYQSLTDLIFNFGIKIKTHQLYNLK
ncbi:hypothetical protein [Staphylococcus sp. FDAARGOS_39]|nr:hypothetical protein [Staphylococcus sp. FDAARGOS_39]